MKKKIYQNGHNHSCDSNIVIADSAVHKEDYAKRAKELGHSILSSLEHGFQGRYYQTYEIAKEYGLKFIFGVEAYWVKNRHEKDNVNNHICIFAKNEKGRRAINGMLSEANITGYYYRPRVDLELIFNLPKEDVFITSACVGFWRYGYEYSEEIVVRLHDYFGDNFMLEVQYHHTESQIKLNNKILELSKQYNIQLFMGCDSHYIYPEDAKERDNVLQAKGIRYEDEDGWFMDYPSGEEAFDRFVAQGVLNEEEILSAMDNTNIFLSFEDITFDKEIKLPTLYPNKTQEERNIIFANLIQQQWNEEKKNVPIELHPHYIEEIRKEMKVVINTKLADYFLLDYHLVKNGVENGGIITKSGRGSGASYYINKLLGFTNVDRISASVKMYPERFISESRILETKSLADLDLNLGTVDIFAKAQTDLLGEGHAYPMIAFGTFKVKSAFKLYARAKELNPQLANEITKQLDKYEEALKYADDDEKDLVDIHDYVDEEYISYVDESKKYQSITSDKKAHPCAYLIYSGDIKTEIGLIKCKSESTKKEVITTIIDGATAEKYKFLKNDLLKVDVVLNNAKVYERAKVKPLSVDELLKSCDDNVWDVYSKGLTLCINQVEKPNTALKAMKYKPRNISELTAFVAAIRPSFKTMYHIFESRQDFKYDIKAFDDILQTKELPYSFVLYQEQMMATLQYAGFPTDETYAIIKAISKKKPEVVKALKDRFKSGFGAKIKETEPHLTDEEVSQNCDKVWQIIEDASNYGFNSSHAYCVALDSLDGAYLKANYPYEFYETMLRNYSEKGNKEKVALLSSEMSKGFGIHLGKYKFRLDNREYIIDKPNESINPALKAIKFLNKKISSELYGLRKNVYNNFTEMLLELLYNTSCNARQIKILIMLDYFIEFGTSKKLMSVFEYFDKRYSKNHVDKTKEKRIEEILEYEKSLPNEEFTPDLKVKAELEFLGYAETIVRDLPEEYVIVTHIEVKYTHPMLTLYRLCNGETFRIKIKKPVYDAAPFEVFDMLKLIEIKEENKWRKTDSGFEKREEKERILKLYNIIK